MNDYSHCKKFLSYIEMKPFSVKFVSVTSCILHMAPFEDRPSVLFVAAL